MRQIDWAGQRFGRLTGIDKAGSLEKYGEKRMAWRWRCDCGNEVIEWPMRVKRGHKQSCGCLQAETKRNNITPCQPGEVRKKPYDITGQQWHRLTAMHLIDTSGDRGARWMFRCDCGNQKVLAAADAKSGAVKSCGCLKRESNTEHGYRMSSQNCGRHRQRKPKINTRLASLFTPFATKQHGRKILLMSE